ncbi:trans-acting T-cell-specific transcription factor GATA-3 [Platysternon megacephalum]|uniref:Trans-acting T-cell-specific transcription factor GATA-3 n=1 Tax=Platysternon megacephalum TaxID=55544 RepID=A0A4D9EV70_9SAUR|nr:trans-acting T-cell-specific transcription factor GATA-3 [Platysternon megacephalum]
MTTIILKLILLTECFGYLANGTNELTISQTPSEIKVSTGMSAEITCSWKNDEIVERFRVTWKIQHLTCKEDTSRELSSKLYYTANATHKDKTVLKIEVVKRNDTGTYFCEITTEIPFMKKGLGNGTTLIVEEKEAGPMENYHFMVILAIFPFLISGGCFYLCYKKQQNSKHSVPERRTHEEQTLQVTELDEGNEINEADERNSSSANSSEWAISTLYESLDYFAMKQDEDKDQDNKHSVTFASNAED